MPHSNQPEWGTGAEPKPFAVSSPIYAGDKGWVNNDFACL